MYESPRKQAAIKATRTDWTVTQHADNARLVTFTSDKGWGNAGDRDIARHDNAMKSRVRRLMAKTYPDSRFKLEVQDTCWYGDGVMYSITYYAKAV